MDLSFLAAQATDAAFNVGPLALVAPLLDQLDIAKIVDRHIPPDPQQEYPYGKVLSLLLAARLCHPNALVRVADWAEEQAATILWNIPAEKLNDDRLGRALDAFFDKRHSILADVTVRALEIAELSMHRLHFDTTHVTFCGSYVNSLARTLDDNAERVTGILSDSRLSPAHITKGYLSDRRMLQAGIVSIVDDRGALPVFCHVADGNRNGHTIIRQQFNLLDKHLPLPDGLQLVSDRGTFSAEHVALLHRHGHSFLGAVPWQDYQSLYDTHVSRLDWQTATFLSQEQQRRRTAQSALPQEYYEIAGVDHRLTDPTTKQPIACRVLFCYSSASAKEESRRRLDNIETIRTGLEQIAVKLQQGHPRTTSQSVMGQIARLLGKRDAARFFRCELVALSAAENAALPAPSKGYTRPTHRLVYTFDAQAAEAASAYDGLSALLTTASKPLDTLFTEYKQQAYIELGHHQWKTPLAVRPVFLKTPKRVESLLCLMHLALQAYQLLERIYRQNTPTNAPKKEQFMTAEQLLRVFAKYSLTAHAVPIGRILYPGRLNLQQRQIIERLKFPTPYRFMAKSIPLAPTG